MASTSLPLPPLPDPEVMRRERAAEAERRAKLRAFIHEQTMKHIYLLVVKPKVELLRAEFKTRASITFQRNRVRSNTDAKTLAVRLPSGLGPCTLTECQEMEPTIDEMFHGVLQLLKSILPPGYRITSDDGTRWWRRVPEDAKIRLDWS